MNKKRTILCMDDDEAIREVLRTYFDMLGFTVLVAENGQIGIELCRLHRPDVVLVDLNMPIVNGFEVLETMMEEFTNLPTIVISGVGEMEDVIKALHLGAWHYLTKPFDNLKIIEHAVTQAVEKALLIKQNEAHQAGLQVKLDRLFEQFQDFVLICGRDMKITYMNPALVSYVGGEQLGKSCQEVFVLPNGQSWWPTDAFPAEGSSRWEVRNPGDDTWYELTVSAILDHDNEVAEYQVIIQDITQKKIELQELHEREEKLKDENSRLLSLVSERFRFGKIIGKSPAMQEIYKTIIRAGWSDASVVIYGESGTGKELVAQSIHDNSKRVDEPFVCVNCGAIPEHLIESEFFGYKKGAFTGAESDKRGFLDVANGGTLFLDEVGEIPLNLQTKLLRAIEGGGYIPIGGTELKIPDVRIIAATNRDLKDLVKEGKIREDFLYRVHIIPVYLPPLRERQGDIPILIDHFLDLLSPDKKISLPLRVVRSLENYGWPGNVRELQNTIQRFLAIGKLDFMGLEEPETISAEVDMQVGLGSKSLVEAMQETEKKFLLEAFEKFDWHQSKTARALQIDRKTLYRKMKSYNIARP